MCVGIVYGLKKDFSVEKLTNVLKFSVVLNDEFSMMLIRDMQRDGINLELSPYWKEWVDAHRYLISI
jgi:hypothetical protein